jgi:hypothetical protein
MMYTPRLPVEKEKNSRIAAAHAASRSATVRSRPAFSRKATTSAAGRQKIHGRNPVGKRHR